MSAIAFDTLKFAKRLKEAGFTEQQAEALADAEAELIEQNLATKRDIAEIKRDIKELEVTLRKEIKQLEVTLHSAIKELDVTLRGEIKELDVTLRGEIKQLDVKIEQIRSDLARDLKDLEYRMTIKLGTMMVVAVGATAALVRLL
ncbi:MAG: hypothetical protein ACREU8_09530 [Gammaproteobacteria bacterium]